VAVRKEIRDLGLANSNRVCGYGILAIGLFGQWAVIFMGLLIAKHKLLKFGYAGTGSGRVWGG